MQIADAIRAQVQDPSFSISIKMNSVEFQDGGFSPEDCALLCQELDKNGFDFVELSGGTYEDMGTEFKRDSTKIREAFFIEFAKMIVPGLETTKVYVTGGLRTANGMAKALETVDGIGLARPATHEFDLPRKMLDGNVEGAMKLLLDDNDIGISNLAAGTQYVSSHNQLQHTLEYRLHRLCRIRLVGNDNEPLDFGRQDHMSIFIDSMQKWMEIMSQNTSKSEYGFVNIEGIDLKPYGTPYPTTKNI